MTILWPECFENYGDVSDMMDGPWAYMIGSVSLVNDSATGVKCLQMGRVSAIRRYLGDDYARAGAAMNVKVADLPATLVQNFGLVTFQNAVGDSVCSVKLAPTGRLVVTSGDGNGPVVAFSKKAMAAGTWNHVEVCVDGATDTVEVRLNGVEVVTASVPITTVSTLAMGVFSGGQAQSGATYTRYDDIVTWGGPSSDFIGICGVHYLPPVADSAPQQWGLTSGSAAWSLVDDLAPNDDADYIFTDTAGRTATLQVAALPSNVASIIAVATVARMRKTGNGDCRVALGVVSGGVQAQGSEVSLTTGYSYELSVFEVDPEDGAGWGTLVLPDISIERTL